MTRARLADGVQICSALAGGQFVIALLQALAGNVVLAIIALLCSIVAGCLSEVALGRLLATNGE